MSLPHSRPSLAATDVGATANRCPLCSHGHVLSPAAHVMPWVARDASASPLRRPEIWFCGRGRGLVSAALVPAVCIHGLRVAAHAHTPLNGHLIGWPDPNCLAPTHLGGDHACCAHQRAVGEAEKVLGWEAVADAWPLTACVIPALAYAPAVPPAHPAHPAESPRPAAHRHALVEADLHVSVEARRVVEVLVAAARGRGGEVGRLGPCSCSWCNGSRRHH